MSYHGGQRYSYQILSAIAYAFRQKTFALKIEGEDFEDSIFYDEDQVIAIGEAKTMDSLNHWTPRSLFYIGSKKGPILQLWNRCNNNETPILFSSIPMQQDCFQDDKIQIPNNTVTSIVNDVVQKISQGILQGINRVNEISDESILRFLKNLEFVHIPFETICQYTMDYANDYGDVTLDSIGRLEKIFTSTSYIGNVRKIPLDRLIATLKKPHHTSIDPSTENPVSSIFPELVEIDNKLTSLVKEFQNNPDMIQKLTDNEKKKLLLFIISTSNDEKTLDITFKKLAKRFSDDYDTVSIIDKRLKSWSDSIVLMALSQYLSKSDDNRIPDIVYNVATDSSRDQIGTSKPFRDVYFRILGEVGREDQISELRQLLKRERPKKIKSYILRTIRKLQEKYPTSKSNIF